jgi:multidrug efflux pump
MREVTGPIIATSLVLSAVFIPTAFISGLTGQFYKQFALTIAISTIISTINSLTLSPALSAVLLKPHNSKPDLPTRFLNSVFGFWLFRPFNRFFEAFSQGYTWVVRKVIRGALLLVLLYVGLLGLTEQLFSRTPTGFVPDQDKQYLVSFAQLPDAASLDRTEAIIRRMTDKILAHPGVESAVAFPVYRLMDSAMHRMRASFLSP